MRVGGSIRRVAIAYLFAALWWPLQLRYVGRATAHASDARGRCDRGEALENPRVGGSIPPLATKQVTRFDDLFKAA